MNLRRMSLSSGEKIALIGNLATMLGAGIPILEAVDSLLTDSKGNSSKVLDALKTDLMQGKHIHNSFSAFPNVFDSVTISLLKAAEEAGTLETTLVDLKDHIQKETEFIDKIKLALVYPILISIVFVGVLIVILLVVVPKISTVFSRLKVELPLPTRILIIVSDTLIHRTLYLGIGFAVGLLLLWFIMRQFKPFFLNLFYSLPVIRGLVKMIDLTRFSRTLHLLLSSGIPIDSALELCKNVVMRRSTAQVIIKSREMILSGKRLADGLRSVKGVIPSIMIKLVEAGEKSGTLDKSMADLSVHLDYQVSNALRTLTSILEPVMLLVVGLSVGGMMLAIIAPIYGLISQVNAR